MITDQLGCWVPVQYSIKGEDPHSYYKDTFHISPKGEYDSNSHDIIWEGHFNEYVITITQKHHHADIEEDHIKYELKPGATRNDSTAVYFPKREIAKTLNEYIDDAFR